MRIEPQRFLNEAERGVVAALLAFLVSGAEELRAQIPHALMVGSREEC
jgi:hypothetical protein